LPVAHCGARSNGAGALSPLPRARLAHRRRGPAPEVRSRASPSAGTRRPHGLKEGPGRRSAPLRRRRCSAALPRVQLARRRRGPRSGRSPRLTRLTPRTKHLPVDQWRPGLIRRRCRESPGRSERRLRSGPGRPPLGSRRRIHADNRLIGTARTRDRDATGALACRETRYGRRGEEQRKTASLPQAARNREVRVPDDGQPG
jgi:hypothetical protein